PLAELTASIIEYALDLMRTCGKRVGNAVRVTAEFSTGRCDAIGEAGIGVFEGAADLNGALGNDARCFVRVAAQFLARGKRTLGQLALDSLEHRRELAETGIKGLRHGVDAGCDRGISIGSCLRSLIAERGRNLEYLLAQAAGQQAGA